VADYRRHRVRWTLLIGLAAVAACARPPEPGPAGERGPARVLVFTRTLGFRHASIPVAIAALRRAAARQAMAVDHTEDPARFTPSGLRRYRVVVFLSTTGDVLDRDGEAALRGFVEAGGGWVGVHAAADTEDGWPWYETLVGARFARHPAVQRATVRVVDRDHPATAGLPATWVRTDEWYDFRSNPRRVQLPRRRDGRRPPDRLVARGRWGAGPVHRRRAHGGGLVGAPLPGPPGGGAPLGRRGLTAVTYRR
jgi:type 1 glutamine amidotransferase